jgi:predicted lipoprotein with Yx(FWY)xxD motif
MRAKHLISGFAVGILSIAGPAAGGPVGRSSGTPTVLVRSSLYGKILVDRQGDTLYLWAKDRKGRTGCTGACLGVTPFLLVPGKPRAGPGVSQKLLGTIKVPGGNEVTYDGEPLYTFVSDFQPGLILGEGQEAFGGPWWVISPAGHAITRTL